MGSINKVFKTLDEQVSILRSKGLIIDNEVYAKDILLRENYFFLNGYRFPLYDENKRFVKGSTFEELYSIFLFDRVLRNAIFKNVLVIENNIKSIMAYVLSRKYGYKESEYLKPKNFDTSDSKKHQVIDILNKMKRQIRINGDQHAATRHYRYNYGYIPLWVLVKVLSFGIIADFYNILKIEDRVEIANFYHIEADELTVYLSLLANYRNICAHEDIIYETKTQRGINGTFYHEALGIKKDETGEYEKGRNDLFSLLIMIKIMLRKEESLNFMLEVEREIDHLNYNLHSIKIDVVLERMGFPYNWKELGDLEVNDGRK